MLRFYVVSFELTKFFHLVALLFPLAFCSFAAPFLQILGLAFGRPVDQVP